MRQVGDRALLVEFDDVESVAAQFASWNSAGVDGVEELIPAARTILVRLSGSVTAERVFGVLSSIAPGSATGADDVVDVPVQYDGPDLAEVASSLDLSCDDVVDLHTGQTWTAAFGGFAPGFAYLVGEHDRLHVARRSSPRTSVPTGSVGLAGEFSGVYPSSSPGGWQLIGTTSVALWDIDRDPPALIAPGTRVRFVRA